MLADVRARDIPIRGPTSSQINRRDSDQGDAHTHYLLVHGVPHFDVEQLHRPDGSSSVARPPWLWSLVLLVETCSSGARPPLLWSLFLPVETFPHTVSTKSY